jgi:hypothetical protein
MHLLPQSFESDGPLLLPRGVCRNSGTPPPSRCSVLFWKACRTSSRGRLFPFWALGCPRAIGSIAARHLFRCGRPPPCSMTKSLRFRAGLGPNDRKVGKTGRVAWRPLHQGHCRTRGRSWSPPSHLIYEWRRRCVVSVKRALRKSIGTYSHTLKRTYFKFPRRFCRPADRQVNPHALKEL